MRRTNKTMASLSLALAPFLAGGFAVVGLTACDGEAEEMGEDIDEAIDDTGNAVEDTVEDAEDEIEDATDGQ